MPSQAHRALESLDILEEIFQHFSLLPRPYSTGFWTFDDAAPNRRALASAALTCKAFSEPASKVLWEVLDYHSGVLPLFSVLGFDDEAIYDEELVIDKSSISNAVWARFDTLAKRVCCFTHTSEFYAPGLLNLLVEHCDGSPIFPNLSVLVWPRSFEDPEFQTLLGALCRSQKLDVVHIKNRGPAAGSSLTYPLREDLDIIVRLCPQLRHLDIDYRYLRLGEEVEPTTLHSFSNLFSVHLAFPGNVYLSTLAVLPSLEELFLNVNGDPFQSPSRDTSDWRDDRLQPQPIPSFRGFHVLRRLHVNGTPSCGAVVAIMKMIASESLASVSLPIYTERLRRDIPCLEVIFSLPCFKSVRSLYLYLHFGIEHKAPPEDDADIDFAIFGGALLALTHLEELNIRLFRRIPSITDADTEKMHVWKNMRRLSIVFRASELFPYAMLKTTVSHPSLNSLVDLALACRRLEFLRMESHRVLLDELAERAESNTPAQTNLKHLVFTLPYRYRRFDLSFENIRRVADLLLRLFPQLQGHYQPSFDRNNPWFFMGDTRSEDDFYSNAYTVMEVVRTSKVGCSDIITILFDDH